MQLEKARAQQLRPNTAKNKNLKFKKFKKEFACHNEDLAQPNK